MVILMRVYMVRHGETDWNLDGRVQGREDIPINSNGIKQAIDTAGAFHDKNIELIITSPLIRARKTAEIIADKLGGQVEVKVDDGLIERDFGIRSGMTIDKKKTFDLFNVGEDGESLDEVKARVIVTINHYASQYKDSNLIMVSHGAAINAVLSVVSGGEIGSGITRLKNACISVFDANGEDIKLIDYNMTADELKEKNI